MELLVVRALERVLAVVVGGLSIYLGYRLFVAVKATGEGSARVKLPSDMTVMVSRVGPGVFFALFGALVVGASFAFPIHYSQSESQDADGPSTRLTEISGVGAQVAEPSVSHARTGTVDPVRSSSEQPAEAARRQAREHVGFLNQTAALLEPSLSEAQRDGARDGTRRAKLYLMRSVWDPSWGDSEAFQRWTEGRAPALPTDGFRAAQEFFSYGSQGAVDVILRLPLALLLAASVLAAGDATAIYPDDALARDKTRYERTISGISRQASGST